MIVRYRKDDILLCLIFTLLFIVISNSGIIRYIALAAVAMFALLVKQKINTQYFCILIHSLIYVGIGSIFCVLNGNFSFNSIKQILIYICSGLGAIAIFSVYNKNKSTRLVDIQFISICLAYLILFAKYFTFESFYYESCMYAYIFGAYGLIYFCQKRYKWMTAAIVFMLLDHKRITNVAFLTTLISLFIFTYLNKNKRARIVNKICKIVLFVAPVLWVWLCSNGFLAKFCLALEINTMGRLEGTGAWNIANNYFSFTPLYEGKGIGWVLEWLEHANIFAFSNLHNDFLAGYIELGFIGFLIWVISFIFIPKVIEENSIKLTNTIYILIGFMFLNFLTDNIYLYITFLFPFYMILLSVLFGVDNYKYERYVNAMYKRGKQ